MKCRFPGVAAVAIMAVIGPVLAADFTVGVGEVRVRSIPGVEANAPLSGDYHDYVEIATRTGEIRITGKRIGRCQFRVTTTQGSRSFDIEVIQPGSLVMPADIRKLLAGFNSSVDVVPLGDKLIVTGRIMTDVERVTLDRVLKMYGSAVDDMTVGNEVMIDVAMTLVEVKHEKGSGAGLLDIFPSANIDYTNYTDNGEAGRLIGGFGDGKLGFSVTADVSNALNAMLISGRGRILARSRVQCRNATEAMLNVGGEIPYNAIGEGGAPSVQYKAYGVTMRVTPQLTIDGKTVLMKLAMQSSQPFDGNPTSGSALSSRSVELEAAVNKGGALLIAGLYSKIRSGSTRTGCLFPIFSSRSAEEDRELLVLVQPRAPEMDIKDFKMIKQEDLER